MPDTEGVLRFDTFRRAEGSRHALGVCTARAAHRTRNRGAQRGDGGTLCKYGIIV